MPGPYQNVSLGGEDEECWDCISTVLLPGEAAQSMPFKHVASVSSSIQRHQ